MSNDNSRVFIVCEPTQRVAGERMRTVDLTPAAKYGEPVLLLKYSQSQLDMEGTVETLQDRLDDFDDEDYLVPIGDPVLMCAAALVAASRNNGRVKLLKWDRLQHQYIPIQLDIKEIA
jgi:hypothetical protein